MQPVRIKGVTTSCSPSPAVRALQGFEVLTKYWESPPNVPQNLRVEGHKIRGYAGSINTRPELRPLSWPMLHRCVDVLQGARPTWGSCRRLPEAKLERFGMLSQQTLYGVQRQSSLMHPPQTRKQPTSSYQHPC